jgi:hypothetical protein
VFASITDQFVRPVKRVWKSARSFATIRRFGPIEKVNLIRGFPMLFAYFGLETILPIVSVIAAVEGSSSSSGQRGGFARGPGFPPRWNY